MYVQVRSPSAAHLRHLRAAVAQSRHLPATRTTVLVSALRAHHTRKKATP